MKIRELKKDTKILFDHMIGDAMILAEIKNDKKTVEEISKMLDEAIKKREEILVKVNHPELKDKETSTKKYYLELREETIDYFNNFYEKLGNFLEEGETA